LQSSITQRVLFLVTLPPSTSLVELEHDALARSTDVPNMLLSLSTTVEVTEAASVISLGTDMAVSTAWTLRRAGIAMGALVVGAVIVISDDDEVVVKESSRVKMAPGTVLGGSIDSCDSIAVVGSLFTVTLALLILFTAFCMMVETLAGISLILFICEMAAAIDVELAEDMLVGVTRPAALPLFCRLT